MDGNAEDDNDATPGGANTGDGFSRREEYRGFSIGGSWQCTDPTKKNLFIRDVDNLGLGYATNLGFEIHFIDTYEWSGSDTSSGYINRYGDNDQKGILIIDAVKDEEHPTRLGKVFDVIGTPNQCTKIEIYTESIADAAELWGVAYDDLLNLTIAHEIGHDVDLHHHGLDETYTCIMRVNPYLPELQTTFCDDCQSKKKLH